MFLFVLHHSETVARMLHVYNIISISGSDSDVQLIARWLACMYRSLDDLQENQEVLARLKTHRLLPLSDGELVSLQDRAVFYPILHSKPNEKGAWPY